MNPSGNTAPKATPTRKRMLSLATPGSKKHRDHRVITEDGINMLCNAINTCGGWLGHSLGLCMPLEVDDDCNYVDGTACEAIDCNHRAYILQNMFVKNILF